MSGSTRPFTLAFQNCVPLSYIVKLRQDLQAVQASLVLSYNNGSAEGHVHCLKYLKRQMYGRANFDLLHLRVLHRSWSSEMRQTDLWSSL